LSNFLIVGAGDVVCQRCPETVISDNAENSKGLVFYRIEELTNLKHIDYLIIP